jgi:S-adenosylmethionine-diacylglycerol 3-amino-3-carboxypropyl transferase
MVRNNISKPNILEYKFMNKIDFYHCWEDIKIIKNALKIKDNDIIFSITSSGCNILNLLLDNPKKIYSVDYNPYQNYLLELKIAAIKNLDYPDFIQLMGLKSSNNNQDIYSSIRENISEKARLFWDKNSYVIKTGLLSVGEQNIKNLGKLLRFLKGENVIEDFFSCETIDRQADYFYKYIYGFPWKISLFLAYNKYLIRLFLCLRILREYYFGRKKSSDYFTYIKNVYYQKDHLEKIKNVYSKIPIKNNNFASLILLGYYFDENCYQPYLKEDNYQLLKKRISKIEIRTDSVLNLLKNLSDDTVDKFSLSNIFDWIDIESFRTTLNEIARVGRKNSKLFYSITRVDRYIPIDFEKIIMDRKSGNELLKEDRTTLYSGFVVGEIKK